MSERKLKPHEVGLLTNNDQRGFKMGIILTSHAFQPNPDDPSDSGWVISDTLTVERPPAFYSNIGYLRMEFQTRRDSAGLMPEDMNRYTVVQGLDPQKLIIEVDKYRTMRDTYRGLREIKDAGWIPGNEIEALTLIKSLQVSLKDHEAKFVRLFWDGIWQF